jgi:hypothetical protein
MHELGVIIFPETLPLPLLPPLRVDNAQRLQARADEFADSPTLGDLLAAVDAVLPGVATALGRADAARAAMLEAAPLASGRRQCATAALPQPGAAARLFRLLSAT